MKKCLGFLEYLCQCICQTQPQLSRKTIHHSNRWSSFKSGQLAHILNSHKTEQANLRQFLVWTFAEASAARREYR